MPIGNITQTMSTISPPPHRGVDVQTVFVNKQEDFQDHLADITIDELNTFKDQLNTRIGEINSTTATMNGYASTASTGASTATTKAGEASTSASAALTSRDQASTFATNSSNSATKASHWADNNYNVEVEAGKYSAKHWATVAQSVDVSNKVDKDMSGYTVKALPINTDLLPLSDSEATFGIKKLSIGDLTEFVKNEVSSVIAPKANTADLKEIGVGQTWQDVTASRVLGVTYTNSTGKPILISCFNISSAVASNANLTINGQVIAQQGTTSGNSYYFVSGICPDGGTYSLSTNGTSQKWLELR